MVLYNFDTEPIWEETPVLTRTDLLDFAWGSGSPGPGVTSTNFTVLWTGRLTVPTTGNYVFECESAGGFECRIDDAEFYFEHWTEHTLTTEQSAPFTWKPSEGVKSRVGQSRVKGSKLHVCARNEDPRGSLVFQAGF